MPRLLALIGLLIGIVAWPIAAASDVLPDAELSEAEQAEVDAMALPLPKPRLGDFDKMKEARVVRFLVPHSKTLFFIDRGRQLGIEVELGTAFGDMLAKKYGKKPSPILVAFMPVPRDQLLPSLIEGLGDVAAGALTVTPERQALVDFSDPYAKGVKEIVVTGPAAPALRSIDDLSGKEIHVRQSSSYYEHLVALSASLEARGLPPIKLIPADEDLEDEDLLEMVNAGLLPFMVVDRYKGHLWAQVFEDIEPRDDLIVNDGGDMAWAIRKGSPLLKAEIDEFVKTHKVGTTFGNILVKKYTKGTKYIQNAYSEEEMKKFQKTVDIFKKHADTYNFDYLMLMAQGYQESGLDQSRKSPRGAVGVMQLLPSTASDPSVGIPGIEKDPDANIQAGAKYLALLREKYLDDPAIDERNRTLMAFAAYNAGPGNLRKFRRLAEKSALDPNIWFNNVEIAASRIVGRETVQYVSNIYKYYVAYKLVDARAAARDKSLQEMQQ